MKSTKYKASQLHARNQPRMGELVRERTVIVASCFLISEFTMHRMNFVSLLFTISFIKDIQMPLVSSCFLSQKSENEISCFIATPVNDHKLLAFT